MMKRLLALFVCCSSMLFADHIVLQNKLDHTVQVAFSGNTLGDGIDQPTIVELGAAGECKIPTIPGIALKFVITDGVVKYEHAGDIIALAGELPLAIEPDGDGGVQLNGCGGVHELKDFMSVDSTEVLGD